MLKFIRKLKENIKFYRWAYANRDIKNKPVSCYVSVNNIEPKLIEVKMVVGNGELHQYEPVVRDRLIQKFTKEVNKVLSMEVQDLMNGTSEVSIRCYISSFVEE